jgi:putative flippase GtrA
MQAAITVVGLGGTDPSVLIGAQMKPSSPLERVARRLRRAWRERAVTLKAASFAAIGAVNTLVDFGVFIAAYTLLDMPLIPANVLAWLIAVTGSYVMNSYITFAVESGRKLTWRAYGAFVASGVAGVIANTATLVVASYWVPVVAAKVMAIAVSFVVNFSLSHFVVFRTR